MRVVRRYDDDDEIVEPQRSPGGQRRYSRNDIARLARVLELVEDGVSTRGIKRILDLEDELAQERGPGAPGQLDDRRGGGTP